MVDLVLWVLGCGFVRGLVVFLLVLVAWFVGFLVVIGVCCFGWGSCFCCGLGVVLCCGVWFGLCCVLWVLLSLSRCLLLRLL